MTKHGYTYMMANNRPTLYVGVTNNLIRRVFEHKDKFVPGFTNRYNLDKLVYYEAFDTIEQAIVREKQIKDLNRDDKLRLISEMNPRFTDLYGQILESPAQGEVPQNDEKSKLWHSQTKSKLE
ncbi:MAG: GIY-YIG nuclease family protein [Patescibacteria group bacterium]